MEYLEKTNLSNRSEETFHVTYTPYIEENLGKFTVFVFFAAIFCFLGVFGNILTIISIVREKFLWVPENVFIISRAISDIIVAGMVLPLSMAGAVEGDAYYYNRVTMCKVLAAICCLICMCTWWTLACLSVSRLALTWFPLKSRVIFTWKTTPVICLLSYIIAFCVTSPAMFGWTVLEYDPEMMMCMVDVDNFHYNVFIFVSNAIPMSITLIALILSSIKLHSRHRQYALVGPEIDLMISTSIFEDSSKREHDPTAKQLLKELEDAEMTVKMMGSLFAVTFILWFPVTIVMLSNHALKHGRDIWAFSSLLGHLQPGVDCFCYIFVNQYFRRGYKTVLCYIFCCSHGQCCSCSYNKVPRETNKN